MGAFYANPRDQKYKITCKFSTSAKFIDPEHKKLFDRYVSPVIDALTTAAVKKIAELEPLGDDMRKIINAMAPRDKISSSVVLDQKDLYDLISDAPSKFIKLHLIEASKSVQKEFFHRDSDYIEDGFNKYDGRSWSLDTHIGIVDQKGEHYKGITFDFDNLIDLLRHCSSAGGREGIIKYYIGSWAYDFYKSVGVPNDVNQSFNNLEILLNNSPNKLAIIAALSCGKGDIKTFINSVDKLCQILRYCGHDKSKKASTARSSLLIRLACDPSRLRWLIKTPEMLCYVLQACDDETQSLVLNGCCDKGEGLIHFIKTRQQFEQIEQVCSKSTKQYLKQLYNPSLKQKFQSNFYQRTDVPRSAQFVVQDEQQNENASQSVEMAI